MSKPKICIDMSPSLVNRTALLDLPAVIVSSLESLFDIDTQFFGNKISFNEACKNIDSLMHEFNVFLNNPNEYKFLEKERGTIPCIYLDPLYVMFNDLRPLDSVLILDVSPISNPIWHREIVSNAYRTAYNKIVNEKVNCFFISDNTRQTFNIAYDTQFGSEKIIHLFLPEKRRQKVKSFNLSPYPYFLFVGSLERRKNIVGTIRAFKLSNVDKLGYKLIIIGGDGHGKEDIPVEYFSDESIVFTGYLNDIQINTAYAKATGFIYLSYLEGFGVPILEAMHYGIPIIASETSAIPEVLGGLGVLVNPDDHVTAAAELVKLVDISQIDRERNAELMQARIDCFFSKEIFENKIRDVFSKQYNLSIANGN